MSAELSRIVSFIVWRVKKMP